MTSLDLIEKLAALPPDALVEMNINGDDGNLVTEDVDLVDYADGVVTLTACHSD